MLYFFFAAFLAFFLLAAFFAAGFAACLPGFLDFAATFLAGLAAFFLVDFFEAVGAFFFVDFTAVALAAVFLLAFAFGLLDFLAVVLLDFLVAVLFDFGDDDPLPKTLSQPSANFCDEPTLRIDIVPFSPHVKKM